MSPLLSNKAVNTTAFSNIKEQAQALLKDKKVLDQKDEDWLYVDPKVFLEALESQKNLQQKPHFQVNENCIYLHNGYLLNSGKDNNAEGLSIQQNSDLKVENIALTALKPLELQQIVEAPHCIDFQFQSNSPQSFNLVLSANQVGSTLCLIKVATGSDLTLNIESKCEALMQSTWIIHCEKSAKLTLNVLNQDASTQAEHFISRVTLENSAQFYQHHLSCDQNLYRLDTQVKSLGENTYTQLSGVGLLEDQQVASFNTLVHLTQPNCESHQEYRTVLRGKSQSDYNGLVYVEPTAQQINSDQMNRNMLLELGPRSYSRPQLQIFADDVRCTHGSTTGQIDPEELLYIQSRGIDENTAKQLLVQAYVSFILDSLSDDVLKKQWKACLSNKIEHFLNG